MKKTKSVAEATTTAAIATYPMGGGEADSVKKQSRYKKKKKNQSFKDWLAMGANEYEDQE